MTDLKQAISLLTRLPVHVSGTPAPSCAVWFAVPALLTGALGCALWTAAFLPGIPYLAALVWAFCLMAVNGALHLDGLADTADALFSCSSPEKKREILHDSRLGTFGTAAVVFFLLGEVILAGSLPFSVSSALSLLAVPLGGKTALAAVIALGKPAPSGMGSGFIGRLKTSQKILSLAVPSVLTVLLAGWPAGAAGAGVSFLLGLLLLRAAEKRIGAATGDILGAADQLGEICTLFFCVLAVRGA